MDAAKGNATDPVCGAEFVTVFGVRFESVAGVTVSMALGVQRFSVAEIDGVACEIA